MTAEERAELERLEKKLQLWMLKLHQCRLMCSALRREIRISREPETRWPGVIVPKPFKRLDKIVILSDELTKMVGELRG